MKQHITKLFFLLFLVFATVFNSCEAEKDFVDKENYQQSKNLSVKKINYDKISSNRKIIDKLEKFNSKNVAKKSNEKVIYSSNGDFYINTEYAYLIERTDGMHSYTFEIIRENPQYILENLVFNQNNNLGYDLYLVQYNITDAEYEQLQNNMNPNLLNKIILTKLEDNVINLNPVTMRTGSEILCGVVTVIPGNTCPGGDQHTLDDVLGGAECPFFMGGFTLYREQTIYSWEPCGFETSNGGSDYPTDYEYYPGSGTGNPSGNTGNPPDNTGNPDNSNPNNPNTENPNSGNPNHELNDDNGNPIMTTPVLPGRTEIKSPCSKIAEQLNNVDFQEKVNIVNSHSAFSSTQETGFSQNVDNTFDQLSVTNGGHRLVIPINDNTIGYIHSHIDSYEIDTDGDGTPDGEISPIKMPSPLDVIAFLSLLENADNNNIPLIDIYGSMYSSANDYTLKFTGNIQNVLNKISILKTKLHNKTLDEQYNNFFKKYNNDEKAFLNFLKNEIGIDGIRLFKINGNTVKEKFLNENGAVDSLNC